MEENEALKIFLEKLIRFDAPLKEMLATLESFDLDG